VKLQIHIEVGHDWAWATVPGVCTLQGHIADVVPVDELLPRLKREGVDLEAITLADVEVSFE
jgi:hypothetical protein